MQKSYIEPARRRRAFKFRVKVYLITGAVVCVLAIAAGFIIHASIFQIKKVEVVGLQGESQEAFLARIRPMLTRSMLGRVLSTTNYFVWPRTLTLNDPHIAQVEVRKSFFRREVTITVTPRASFGIWCFAVESACVWIDNAGTVLEKAPVPEGVLIPVVYDSAPTPLPSGEHVLPSEMFMTVVNTLKALHDLKIPVKHYELNRISEELHALTPTTVIKISLRLTDSRTAIDALQTLLQKEPLSKFEYIDLTVEKRIFVKRK